MRERPCNNIAHRGSERQGRPLCARRHACSKARQELNMKQRRSVILCGIAKVRISTLGKSSLRSFSSDRRASICYFIPVTPPQLCTIRQQMHSSFGLTSEHGTRATGVFAGLGAHAGWKRRVLAQQCIRLVDRPSGRRSSVLCAGETLQLGLPIPATSLVQALCCRWQVGSCAKLNGGKETKSGMVSGGLPLRSKRTRALAGQDLVRSTEDLGRNSARRRACRTLPKSHVEARRLPIHPHGLRSSLAGSRQGLFPKSAASANYNQGYEAPTPGQGKDNSVLQGRSVRTKASWPTRDRAKAGSICSIRVRWWKLGARVGHT